MSTHKAFWTPSYLCLIVQFGKKCVWNWQNHAVSRKTFLNVSSVVFPVVCVYPWKELVYWWCNEEADWEMYRRTCTAGCRSDQHWLPRPQSSAWSSPPPYRWVLVAFLPSRFGLQGDCQLTNHLRLRLQYMILFQHGPARRLAGSNPESLGPVIRSRDACRVCCKTAVFVIKII